MRRRIVTLFLGLFLVALSSPQAVAFGSGTSFERVDLFAELQPDGSMEVVEKLTANVGSGASSMAREIDQSGPASVVDVAVEENGTAYNRGESGQASTFNLTDTPDRLKVEWSFPAGEKVRTFTLRYRVESAVIVHRDVAELSYRFFINTYRNSVGAVGVRLDLPAGADSDEVRAWLHEPVLGSVTEESPELITWQVKPLPVKDALSGRVVFPPDLVPESTLASNEDGLPAIEAEEATWANTNTRERWLAQLDQPMAVGILAVGFTLGFLFIVRFRRGNRPEPVGEYYRQLPAAYSPAELGILLHNGKVTAAEWSATMLDLARRGFIHIEEVAPTQEKQGLFSRAQKEYRISRVSVDEAKTAELKPYEKATLDLLEQVGSLSGLQKYAEEQKEAFAAFWTGWRSAVVKDAEALNFNDRKAWKGKLLPVLIGFLFLVCGLFTALVLGFWWTGVATVLAGLFIAFITYPLRRRSAQGELDYARWLAFGRFLKGIGSQAREQIPPLAMWEQYLVYAVSLGEATDVLSQLPEVFPNWADGEYRFGMNWYAGSGGAPSPEGIPALFKNLNRVVTKSVDPLPKAG